MTVVVYDGSFEGLLTAVFEIYEYKLPQPFIARQTATTGSLFGETHIVITNVEKSTRVYQKIKAIVSLKTISQLYDVYLSEIKEIENVLLRFIQYALQSSISIENDYTNADVLLIQQTSKKVNREKHRMKAFVRFQLTKDQLYYCIIQPDYNVLPLIGKHFRERYADQRWLIYDGLRKYGLYYNGENIEEVQMHFEADLNNEQNLATLHDEKEELYQQLWKQYFSSVNIQARKNMKLHIRHMPKRYWRFLVEKQ
ncbi:TIGR03915 family putative DNA repair protein [Ferruginibacter sp.]|uniref:TIGR03915 family putative DNA repair protein n=1 Tax=Ferruginibacter sp. TaxID=1940288 RepID=UPI0019B41755|nr:TIGR03915 family putative DNA repair protein [Ferruginibacter sp.]MBC7627421.1 TIGR03915 family putative DNA repair protein [Ferruginibacter sp.]